MLFLKLNPQTKDGCNVLLKKGKATKSLIYFRGFMAYLLRFIQ